VATFTIQIDDDIVNAIGIEFVEHVILHKQHEAVVLCEKQADYGPNNIALCPVGPLNGLLVRLYDKIARLANLTRSERTPNNEALTDTGLDIANYGTIISMVLTAHWPNLPHDDL